MNNTISSLNKASMVGGGCSTHEVAMKELYKKLSKKGLMFDGNNLEEIEVKKGTEQFGISFANGGYAGNKSELVNVAKPLSPSNKGEGYVIKPDIIGSDMKSKKFYLFNPSPQVKKGDVLPCKFKVNGELKTINIKIV